MRYLTFFFAAGLLLTRCYAQGPAKTDICQVVADPFRFKGTLIEVRGVVRNRDEPTVGSDLCPKRLVVDKITFRNEILLEPLGKPSLSGSGKEAFAEMRADLQHIAPASQHVFATFVGVLETRDSFSDLVRAHGEIFGYGHLSRAPAQLVLSDVRDISVVAKPDPPPTHSVCELLESPLSFNGTVVAVKGFIEGNGFWTYDDQCPTHIEVQGHRFENIIAVSDAATPIRLHDVEFDTDDDSVALIGKAFGQGTTMRPYVSATLVGLFETRPGLNLIAPNGSSWGFGQLGRAPAELLLKECREATAIYIPRR